MKESSFVARAVTGSLVFKVIGARMKVANFLGSNLFEPKILFFNVEETYVPKLVADPSIEIINRLDPTISSQGGLLKTQD